MHLPELIGDLAVILATAGLVSFLFRWIKQPVVLGYVLAGMIVESRFVPVRLISDLPNIRSWADLGVVFLMFSLGLEVSFRKLARVGISAGMTALFEVSAMALVGYATCRGLEWSKPESIMGGLMLSVSSTTIVVKTLDELKLKSRRFAEMILAILVVEDLLAILMLVLVPALLLTHRFDFFSIAVPLGKLALIVGGWFVLGYFLIPHFIRLVGRVASDEVLTIVSLGLCLGMVVLAAHFQYSTALGAFIMGSILAESTESHRIEELVAPLRDVFAAVFFVSVGMLIDPELLVEHFRAIAVMTVVLVVGKSVFVTLGAMIFGQTLRTSIQVGTGIAQVGEFSFILAGVALNMGFSNGKLYPIAVAVSILTAFTTPYMIRYSHRFAVWFEGRLPLRLKDFLSRYASWNQERKADRLHRSLFYKFLFKWILNAIVVSLIFLAAAEYGFVQYQESGWRFARWLVSCLLSIPFMGAMWNSFSRGKMGAGTLFLSRLLTVSGVGALSLKFFPPLYAVAVTGLILILLFVFFYRQIEESYRWFERRFMSVFDETRPKSFRASQDFLRRLAPWDAHLVRIKVHPNSEVSGQKLVDTQFRSRFGLTVVAIQRGLKTVVAPGPETQIFPKDELLVLGTDEQIEAVKTAIEKPPGLGERFRNLESYQLKSVRLPESSALLGATIKDAGFRERYSCLVVGIEREDQRVLNPDSEWVLKSGDVLWVVGDAEKILTLEAE